MTSAAKEAEQLSQLLGDIYDAALDAGLWPSVVEGIARYVPGSFVNLFSQDATRKTAQAFYTYGIDREYLDLYFQKYIHINPLFPGMLFCEVGRVLTENDIVPKAEFNETRFYKEWIKPQGLIDSMAAILQKSATSVAGIAVGRGEREGLVDADALRRMRLIVPHVRRAVTIGNVIDLHKIEAAAFADTLDAIAVATILVDGSGRIMHTNAAGDAMLATGAVLRAAGGKLLANDPQADRTLHDTFTSAGGGAAAVGAGVLLRGSDGESWIAHVLPLSAGARRKAGVNYSAAAAVFLRKAALEPPHPLETIASLYKLTTAEMRVLMAVVQIGGVPEIAPVLGIAETTVKTHLRHVFEKTGTKRQADLVKLVAAHMSPLAP